MGRLFEKGVVVGMNIRGDGWWRVGWGKGLRGRVDGLNCWIVNWNEWLDERVGI